MAHLDDDPAVKFFPRGMLDLIPYPSAREQAEAMAALTNRHGAANVRKFSRKFWNSAVAYEIHTNRRVASEHKANLAAKWQD